MISSDVQTLSPGNSIILYTLDSTSLGGELLHFHGYMQEGPIYWQGVSFAAWPITDEGFDLDTQQPPTPKLTVGNIDGTISALCLAFDDLLLAKLTRHRTFVQYLDAANFPGGNPTADPTQELPPDIWVLEQKLAEDSEHVQWALSNPMNMQGQQLPGRPIIANMCGWVSIGGYRGPYCGYTGGPVADIYDVPTSDSAKDMCSGTLKGCKLRFGANNELPFGSYPAAGLVR
jgi:lambda family phage minor tail protein L